MLSLLFIRPLYHTPSLPVVFTTQGGESLRRHLAARGPVANQAALPEAQAAAVMGQVVDAVIYMHLKGVVHCKLGPDR